MTQPINKIKERAREILFFVKMNSRIPLTIQLILQRFPIVEATKEDVEHAGYNYLLCTNFKSISINYNHPVFVNNEITESEFVFYLFHEALHIAGIHHIRQGDRNLFVETKEGRVSLWNLACDYWINSVLSKFANNHKLLNFDVKNYNICYSEKYHFEKYATPELIYDALCEDNAEAIKNAKEVIIPGAGGKFSSGKDLVKQRFANESGSDGDKSSEISSSEHQISKSTVSDIIKDAASKGQSNNKSSFIDNLVIKDLPKPILKAKDVISMFTSRYRHQSFSRSYNRMPRRQSFDKFYHPGIKNLEKPHLAFGIDVSGSIPIKTLLQFISEVNGLFTYCKVTIFTWDTDIHNLQSIKDKAELLKYKVRNGGGTDPAPALDYLVENKLDIDGLIMMTDGYFSMDKRFKKYPINTLWCVCDNTIDRLDHIVFGKKHIVEI